jgi:DNA-binding NarL/FixJ family response regulator
VDLPFHLSQPTEVLLPCEFALPRQKRISVMLADSHPAIRRGVRALLERHPDAEVIAEAANGRDALRIAEVEMPDIAIIDSLLPELNALDLIHALKRKRLPTEILLYSMSGRDDLMSDVLKAGARGFVLKEESEQHLLAAIDALWIGRPYFSPAISDKLLDQLNTAEWHSGKANLTSREREILQLIAEGAINKAIAFKLGITTKTVETHRMSAMRRIKARNTADLVRWAIRNNLVEA